MVDFILRKNKKEESTLSDSKIYTVIVIKRIFDQW